MKSGQRWALIVATMPVWPILWLLAFAAVARLKLGVWPRFARPDPSDLHLPLLDIAVLPLLVMAPLALLASLALAFRRWYIAREDWRVPLLSLISFAVLVAWLTFDPGGFFEWWAD